MGCTHMAQMNYVKLVSSVITDWKDVYSAERKRLCSCVYVHNPIQYPLTSLSMAVRTSQRDNRSTAPSGY